MSGPVDVPYAVIEKMMGDLDETMSGEGFGTGGERFIITRYRSRTTGQIYDCVFSGSGERHCAEISEAAKAKSQDAP